MHAFLIYFDIMLDHWEVNKVSCFFPVGRD